MNIYGEKLKNANNICFFMQTERRGYFLCLSRGFFDTFVLYLQWYGIRNNRRGKKQKIFKNEKDAIKEINRILRLRNRHGYVLKIMNQ